VININKKNGKSRDKMKLWDVDRKGVALLNFKLPFKKLQKLK